MLFNKIPFIEPDFVTPPDSFVYQRVDKTDSQGLKSSVMEKKVATRAYDGFSARDFQLQEILESGSTDLLTPVSPIAPSKLSSLDSASAASGSMQAALDRADAAALNEAAAKEVSDTTE